MVSLGILSFPIISILSTFSLKEYDLKQKKNVETINDFDTTHREKNGASSFQNLVSSLYTLVTDNYQNVSIKLFEKLEKNKSIQLYEFIVKYNYIFKVSNEVLKEMENLVREKVKNDNLIKTYEELGYIQGDSNATEMIKKI